MRLSVTTRIALLSIALALASNLAVIVFVWQRTESDAVETVRRDVIEQADALLAVWRRSGDDALIAAIDEAQSTPDPTQLTMVADRRGRRLEGEGPARLDGIPLTATHFRIDRIAHASPWRDHDAGYVLRRVGARWLLVGRSLLVVEQQRHALERALIVAVLVSLMLGVAAGVVVSRYVARRLVRIAGVVDAVGRGDLTRRVPLIAGGGDAFDRLAVRLNATLDRVERLMGELRVVTDSLAHDLRSPLARLRTRAEQAAAIEDPAAREAALSGLVGETDLVMRMLSTVIEISRSEAASRDRFTQVEPAGLLEELADLYEPVVEDADRRFVLALEARPAAMPLHRELLSQAIGNLIENSLKHGAGTLTLALGEAAGQAVMIEVRDRGPGIAEADRDRALRRFGRLDAARTTPGAGLGMALVDAVARLHGGRFELDDHAPGLIARIVLPR